MIDLLDHALRTLLLRGLTDLDDDLRRIGFQPPDDEWRAAVASVSAVALNVYLAEVRQNRDLRSTARHRFVRDDVLVDRPAPTWLECRYLISAWSPAAAQVEPTPIEHALLYRAVAVLQDAAPVNPTHAHGADTAAIEAWPDGFRDVDLPTQLMPVDGFAKLAEFWGTMGTNHRWRPVVELAVGLPVLFTEPVVRGPAAVTLTLRTGPRTGEADEQDVRVQLGGQVRGPDDRPPTSPVAVTVVEVASGLAVHTTTMDPATGRFVVDLPLGAVADPDRFRLRATTAAGMTAEVPADPRLPGPVIRLGP
ncbi:Pvc16 family protein [Pseudonocardia charpentierae]|uniref:Pvc16 family protein n=1 Tax=Pseudonocardia charpentierae TaxID=3075545 RepID=A0ABU2NHS9_9PSEU|nr:Pvc16 family protein [Pseudonocardia sp. DSM 45834]MDT0353127.1 Pvc16 family protein [Pseudonocardia sp. DSM 45834]